MAIALSQQHIYLQELEAAGSRHHYLLPLSSAASEFCVAQACIWA
jgi:hypothetical protein